MQTNLLWTGLANLSLENCLLTVNENGATVNAVIIGHQDHNIYKVEYRIETNASWETLFFDIKTQFSDQVKSLSYHSDGKGNWMHEGKPLPEFKGCIDIDLPLTPFTNTLPINRIQLAIGESRQIKVLYLDILNHDIQPLTQKYTRISAFEYKYENVPNDFEAIIAVDEAGLVVDYPTLFLRSAKMISHYPAPSYGE